ncbi:MAG: hypothetical protein AVDCRST_MAG30-2084, partial [uncultured Solirubrobacteraceae bacterium]
GDLGGRVLRGVAAGVGVRRPRRGARPRDRRRRVLGRDARRAAPGPRRLPRPRGRVLRGVHGDRVVAARAGARRGRPRHGALALPRPQHRAAVDRPASHGARARDDRDGHLRVPRRSGVPRALLLRRHELAAPARAVAADRLPGGAGDARARRRGDQGAARPGGASL